ncbi:MAG: DUF1836 domain-containing protein [Faecalibacillus sp.]
MNKDELNRIIEKVISRSYITTDDIPDLDLYMDQIMTLFDKHLDDNKRYEDDKLLTKTMINNYSKAKVISPVKGKKYSKEQIIQMLMIYYLKNNLTIQEIKKILSPLYDQDIDLKNIYDQFITIKHEQTKQLKQFINQQIDSYHLDVEKNEDRLIIMMILSSLSYSLTSIEELMVDKIEDEA